MKGKNGLCTGAHKMLPILHSVKTKIFPSAFINIHVTLRRTKFTYVLDTCKWIFFILAQETRLRVIQHEKCVLSK